MSGLDSFIDSSISKKKEPVTPNIIDQTLEMGCTLVNTDWLPILEKVKLVKKHIPKDVKKFNLYDYGWRFQFGTSKQWAGLCHYGDNELGKSKVNRNIYASIDFVKNEANWRENMRHTLIHECAHAVVAEIFYWGGKMNDLAKIDKYHNEMKGHGLVWNEVCKAMHGGECEMYYNNAAFTEQVKPYKYKCFNCGELAYGSFNNFAKFCKKCKKPVITEKN